MAAEHPVRRNRTARELADQFGASTRTIVRLMAEPRDEFEARARQRREHAAQMRREGKTYKEIAEDMGISTGAVGALLHIARKEGLLPPSPSDERGQADAQRRRGSTSHPEQTVSAGHSS